MRNRIKPAGAHPAALKARWMRSGAMLALLLFLLPGLGHAQTIVCFGDSLTAGYRADPGQSYPDYLRKDLQKAGYHATVLNQGISGDTTKDGLARIGAVLQAKPSIVILELGANDGLRGQPTTGIQQNLSVIIRALRAHGIRVLLAGIYLPPNLGPDYSKQFEAIYTSLAAQYRLPFLPFLLQNVYNHPEWMSDDGMHPNGLGYERVAQNVMQSLTPMLKK